MKGLRPVQYIQKTHAARLYLNLKTPECMHNCRIYIDFNKAFYMISKWVDGWCMLFFDKPTVSIQFFFPSPIFIKYRRSAMFKLKFNRGFQTFLLGILISLMPSLLDSLGFSGCLNPYICHSLSHRWKSAPSITKRMTGFTHVCSCMLHYRIQ